MASFVFNSSFSPRSLAPFDGTQDGGIPGSNAQPKFDAIPYSRRYPAFKKQVFSTLNTCRT